MKFNAWYLAPVSMLTVALFSQGHYTAQLGVIGLTFGIFFGTLSLRRPAGDATTTNPGHG